MVVCAPEGHHAKKFLLFRLGIMAQKQQPPVQVVAQSLQGPDTVLGVEEELQRIRDLEQRGLIDAGTAALLRARALNLPVVPAEATKTMDNVQHTIEDTTSRARREMKQRFDRWCGTPQAPCMKDELYDAVCGNGYADEELRIALSRIMGKSLCSRHIFRELHTAGPGKVPASLVGEGPSFETARVATRHWLTKVAAEFAASIMIRNHIENATDRNRKSTVAQLKALFSDGQLADTAVVLATGLKSFARVSNAPEGAMKRTRQNSPEHEHPTKGDRDKIKCHNCGGRGHMKAQCPTKKKGN